MEKDVLIQLRKKLKMGKNLPLIIESDENYVLDERYNLVMWDDSSGILYGAGPNQHRETQVGAPAALTAITYDNVVRVEGTYSSDDFKTLLDSFVSDGKTSTTAVEALMDQIFNLTDINMYVPAKDRDPEILKKVDVATGHYSNEAVTPYEPPTENLEVNPVITDMSTLTNLDEVYANKMAAFEAQKKDTLIIPEKPVPPEPTYEDRRQKNNSSNTTDDQNTTTPEEPGATVVSGGGEGAANTPGIPPLIPDPTSDTGSGEAIVSGGGPDIDDLDDDFTSNGGENNDGFDISGNPMNNNNDTPIWG